jgi:DNA-binding MarR family transcriptional regulator
MSDPAPSAAPFEPATLDLLIAWQALEMSSRRVRESFASGAGLSLNDFQTLVFLSAENGSAPKSVAQALGLTTGAVTALIDRLEKGGYVTREPHPSDRRSTRLVLTETGMAAATRTGARYVDVVQATIPEAERPGVTDLFLRLAAALDGVDGGHESARPSR